MLYLKIQPPILVNGEVHQRTIVEVSDTVTFDTLLIQDDRSDELLTRSYNISLVTNKDYFLRVRFYLEPGGLQAWSDVQTFRVTDTNDAELFIIPPIYADIPTITSNIEGVNYFPIKYQKFDLSISKDMEGKVKHIDWLLFDTNNRVVDSVTGEESSVLSFYVRKQLEMNKVYTLKASVTTITNTTSDFTSFVFRTQKANILVKNETIKYDGTNILSFDINPINQFVMEFYGFDNNLLSTVNDSGLTINVNDYIANADDVLFLRIREATSDVWEYVYRRTTENNVRLPFTIPASL